MVRVDAGRTGPYCDGFSRRSFLRLGVAGMASVGLGGVGRALAESPAPTRAKATAKSCLLIWLDGGPSHLDLYDLKPEAPEEIRGLWKPIPTNVPGVEISELFPMQAQVADKFSILRSLHHGTGDHFAGGHRMLTTKAMGVSGGQTAQRFPSLGAILTRELDARQPGMPAYVAVPYASSIGLRPGYFGGHMLGSQFDPFQTDGDPNAPNFKVANLEPVASLSLDRLESRRALSRHFDRTLRDPGTEKGYEVLDRFDRDAFEFVTGPRARMAFDLAREDPKLRDRYGRDHWGQSTLLARRLVEAGSTFVTVHLGGWDHHWDLEQGMKNYLPMVDRLFSALLEDLDTRGLLGETLVLLCGEFSRTPRMNDGGNGGPPRSKGTPGRDHWGDAMFCVLAGGGIAGGRVVGSTDRKGYAPATRAVTPSNLHATIYRAMGVDPMLQLLDHQGRPVNVLDDPTDIPELFA
jgi:hypothetical protein